MGLMYCTDQLGCSSPRLGALPSVASLNPVTQAVSTVTGLVTSLFSGSDPAKDRERKNRIDGQYNQAMAGNAAAVSCLRDMAQGVSSGPNDPRTCAVGSSWAAAYAKAKWIEYQARVAAGQVGGALIGQSNLPTTAVGAVKSMAPLVIGGVLLAVAASSLRSRRAA